MRKKKSKKKKKNTHVTAQKEINMNYRSNTSDIYLVQNARNRKINNSVATLSEFGGEDIYFFKYFKHCIAPRNVTVSYPNEYT